MNKIKFVYLLLILFSCKDKSTNVPSFIDNIYITQANGDESYAFFDSLFLDYRCLELEEYENKLIGNIDKFEVYNDYIYILDKRISRSIFIYSVNGKFVNQISNIGKGPGEFVKIESVNFNKALNRIEVFDSERQVLLFYDLLGNFISEIKPPITFEDFVYDSNTDSYYFYCKYFPNTQGNYRIYVTDQNFNVTDKILEFDKSMIGSTMISMYNNFVKNDDVIYFMESYNNVVYTINLEGMQKNVNLKFYSKNVDNDLISMVYDKHETVQNEMYSYVSRFKIGSNFQFYEFPYNNRSIQKYLKYEDNEYVFSNIINISEKFAFSRLIHIDEENNELYFVYDPAANGNSIVSNIDVNGELGSLLNKGKDIFSINPIILICKLK